MSVLRRLARVLIRGPDAPWILNDLEELMSRDVERGMSAGRARWRYMRNAVGSAVSTWRERRRAPRGSIVSWVDVKLGTRMLAKNPGLALVSVLGMAVAITIGAASFAVIYTLIDPVMPLDEGDRVVTIQNIDASLNDQTRRTHLHDMEMWRRASTLAEIGAHRPLDRNVVTPGARIESVRTAEMTASGFRIARVSPLLGRYFRDEDELPGAGDVVIIGYDVWQGRFGGDPQILGQTVQLGRTHHTIIGVMPRGFAFPVNNDIWTPLRLDPAQYPQGDAPPIDVFGRLAPGVSEDEAQAELSTMAAQLATAYPDTRQHVRAEVIPYASVFLEGPDVMGLHLIQLLVTMLLVVIGTNVAALVYARTATRTGEIAVRTALGASRGRVLGQLFIEALVMTAIAAAAGLAGAHLALEQINAFMANVSGGQLPFWWDFSLTPGVLLYAAGLAVLAAVIVGFLPGLRATTRTVLAGMLHSGPGGGGMQLGRTWTVLIVSQVAVAVAILPFALHMGSSWLQYRAVDPGFAADEFLGASLYLDREDPAGTPGSENDAAFMQRYAALQAELVRRLEADARVADVVFTAAPPGGEEGRSVEVDDPGAAGARTMATDGDPRGGSDDDAAANTRGAGVAYVEPDFFDALGIPLLAGRALNSRDIGDDATAVVVNTSFVERVLGGGNALGRRIRYSPEPRSAAADEGQWYEIVGVVPGFPFPTATALAAPRVYHAIDPGELYPVHVAVRVRGDAPAALAPRVQQTALAVDPMLRLGTLAPMSDTMRDRLTPFRLAVTLLLFVTLSTVLLSAAGIYALMSFTVARRRREIGIRSALGAQPTRVLASVLRRAMRQLAVGIVIGIAFAALLDAATRGEMLRGKAVWLLPTVALVMMAVGAIAALGPARTGLRIQPTEALKSE